MQWFLARKCGIEGVGILKAKQTRSRLFLLAAVIWIAVVATSLIWNWYESEHAVITAAISEARIAFEKDIVYRRWASSHGGVYVPPSETTPPNPYLAHIPD
ncbi:MAG TPA: signal transduction protein, partial [bacterium]|nr:signal transduction protein [bacterium]